MCLQRARGAPILPAPYSCDFYGWDSLTISRTVVSIDANRFATQNSEFLAQIVHIGFA
jgi:hypothetical protein